jgi:threonine/homoserine/homoserine lactone efflux protein
VLEAAPVSPDILIAIIGFAAASSITPGPNNLLVMTSGLNHGVVASLPLVAGISFGFAFMVLAVGIGLGAVIQAHPGLHTATKAAGLCYMLWLAWKVATAPPALDARSTGSDQSRPLSAIAGAAFQWVNPKAWAVALSATAAFSTPGAEPHRLIWLAAIFAMVAVGSLTIWSVFGGVMRRLVDNPRAIFAFNVVMALLLVASAVPIAFDLAGDISRISSS